MKYFMPPLLGLFSFFLYMIIYRPALGSEDFITAVLVFFAAMAWSAVITLSKEKKQWVLYLYLCISIVIPLLMALACKEFNILWHMVLIGLTLLAILGLQLFIPGYFKYKRKD